MKTETTCRFAVGDRVVCIEPQLFRRCTMKAYLGRQSLRPHTCYVVRGLDHSETGNYDTERGPEPGLYLVGKYGMLCPDGSEASYPPDDFIGWEEYQGNLRAAKQLIPAHALKFWRA